VGLIQSVEDYKEKKIKALGRGKKKFCLQTVLELELQ
jgi:hypothetical protein